MLRVDFYILAGDTGIDRFACGIAAKAWSQGHRVHIHTASAQAAAMMDDMLWTFRDVSFVPHELYDGHENKETPITIGYSQDFPKSAQVFINLDSAVPADIAQFKRVIEIAGGDEEDKHHARRRYRHYRDKGHEIHHHKIDNPSAPGW